MNKRKDNIDNRTKLLSEIMFELEKACRLKETVFCNICNMTPMEFRCIMQLSNHCFFSVKELSKKMNLSAPRVTHLLNKIEKKGFLKRKIDSKDRRIIKVSLNSKGLAFAKQAYKRYMDFHTDLLNFMDSEEISPTILRLQKFHKTLTHFLENKI